MRWVLVGPHSAIQPPFVINVPCSLGYTRKLSFGSPSETISPPVRMRPTCGDQESNLHIHHPLMILGRAWVFQIVLVVWSLGDTFLVPLKFIWTSQSAVESVIFKRKCNCIVIQNKSPRINVLHQYSVITYSANVLDCLFFFNLVVL